MVRIAAGDHVLVLLYIADARVPRRPWSGYNFDAQKQQAIKIQFLAIINRQLLYGYDAGALLTCVGYAVTSLFTEQPLVAEQAKDNVVEAQSIRFTDDQGATLATLTVLVRRTKVEGKPTPQLVVLETHGNEVWTAPPEFRAFPLSR